MGHAALNLSLSAADFLAWDATQTTRHEFVRGEAWVLHPSAPGQGVQLVSVGLAVTSDALWAEVPAVQR